MDTPTRPGRGRGLPRRSIEEATALVRQWQASGQNQQIWCDAQGILRSALQSCLRRTLRKSVAAPPVSHPFVELQRRPEKPAGSHVVRLALAGSRTTVDLTLEDLGALIQCLSEAQP
jgi:hypothetical protein